MSDISKLPKWAQAKIREMEARICELEGPQSCPDVSRDLLHPKPGYQSGLIKGWDYNINQATGSWGLSHSVYQACSSSVHHGAGWDKTSSQGARNLYSTERTAWQALRAEMHKQWAKKIAEVDRKIMELKP